MKKIGLKKLLLQIKNIDFKGAFYRFCKSDNPLKYVLFPLGILCIIRVLIWESGDYLESLGIDTGFLGIFGFIGLIAGFLSIPEELVKIIYEYFDLYDSGKYCSSCIMSVIYPYALSIITFSVPYLIWDIVRKKVNFSIGKFKEVFVLKNNNIIFLAFLYFLWPFNCFRQFIKGPLKKVTLIFLIPITFTVIAGNYNYCLFKEIIPKGLQCANNIGGRVLKNMICNELEIIYENKYLEKDSFINHNPPGRSMAKEDIEYFNYGSNDSASSCYNSSVQLKHYDEPEIRNIYFNNIIYLGIYEELKEERNKKLLTMIEDICKYPCYYQKAGRGGSASFLFGDLECKWPLEKRKYQEVIINIYNKNNEIVDKAKIKRGDK
jgi:hypothetical protein